LPLGDNAASRYRRDRQFGTAINDQFSDGGFT
jgi:hypothetical protein